MFYWNRKIWCENFFSQKSGTKSFSLQLIVEYFVQNIIKHFFNWISLINPLNVQFFGSFSLASSWRTANFDYGKNFTFWKRKKKIPEIFSELRRSKLYIWNIWFEILFGNFCENFEIYRLWNTNKYNCDRNIPWVCEKIIKKLFMIESLKFKFKQL